MFRSADLNSLVELLEKRGVHLYHSCQYQDFCSYLELGGVASRAKLEELRLPMTAFESDSSDRVSGVWDKVFLNMDDFGRVFASGGSAAPTAYGPVLFRFHPKILLLAADVAICLRTASCPGFDREAESLSSVEDVDRIFFYAADSQHGSAALKFRDNLQAEFGKSAQAVEISCAVPRGILTLEHLCDVVVDPYDFDEWGLAELVSFKATEAALTCTVNRRPAEVGARAYDCLLSAARPPQSSIQDAASTCDCPPFLRWAQRMQSASQLCLRNYDRFLRYFWEGTVVPVEAASEELSDLERPRVDDAEEFVNEYVLIDGIERVPMEEDELLLRERADDSEDWARSDEDGWFYADEDDETDEVGVP